MHTTSLLVLTLAVTAASALFDCQKLAPNTSTPALNETCKLLSKNYDKYDVIFGPHHYDNHLAYFIIALFRMGASADRIREAYTFESKELNPAIPSQHMIDKSSWREHLRQGLYYKDYVEFLRSERHTHGLEKMLELYAPTAMEGLQGGLLHPMIQLGYGFELGDEELVTEGVAWLLSHGDRFPKLNPKPKYTYLDADKILAAMRVDVRLPTHNISLSSLQANYADILSEYDIQLPEGDTQVTIPQRLEEVALQIFGTSCNNFFLLHLSTGSRALAMILPHMAGAEVRSAALQQMWKAMVYIYALEGRPLVSPPPPSVPRPWADLVAAALPINDSHFQKMVYLLRENYRLSHSHDWWLVAERVVTIFESGGGWVFESAGDALDKNERSATKIMFV